jgi:hypothetical protein
MDFETWVKHDPSVENYITRRTLKQAFDAGIEEGLRQAAEKEARKKPTGMVLNEEFKTRPDEPELDEV